MKDKSDTRAVRRKARERGPDGVPIIPLKRTQVAGELGSIIKHVDVEQRGIRSTERRAYDGVGGLAGTAGGLSDMRAYLRALDTAYGFEQASPEFPPNIDLALTEKAKAILKGSGEKIPEEVIATVKSPEERIGRLPFTQGTHALGQWYNSIAERRGHLSQEGTAAKFLFDREVFATLARGNTALINAAFRLCESWHWLSNEVTGAHALVVEGLGAMRGRASSAPARTSRKKLAQDIVTSEYVAYRDGLFEQARKEGRSAPHPGTYKVASTVAARISERVAACFKARGMEPYSELTLTRALGPIIKSFTSLNTRPTVQNVSER